MTCGLEAAANTVALEWDAVDDDRVAFYEVHWGTQSGQYAASQQTTATSATIAQLAAGETYFFAAKACDETGATCSDFSEELSTTWTMPRRRRTSVPARPAERPRLR